MVKYEDKITVFSSTPLSSEIQSQLTLKLKKQFGDYEIVFLTDTALVLGISVHFKDNEYNYNLVSETNYILSELLK